MEQQMLDSEINSLGLDRESFFSYQKDLFEVDKKELKF